MKKIDQRTLNLLEQIRQQKEKISEISNPRWKTKCVFADEKREYNLHTLNVQDLIYVFSMIVAKRNAHVEALKLLGFDVNEYPFLWQGYTFDEWKSDIDLRIRKINIEVQKTKLANLESKLTNVMTPELLAELSLREIEKELT